MSSSQEKSATQAAVAGRCGENVRSDLEVRVEPRPSGGLEIALESRVKPYYGNSILVQTREVLETLGVKHALVSIQDEGALPFVISARIETAIKRTGLAAGNKALPDRVPRPGASARDRVRRSHLYLPGTEPKYFINSGLHGPDAVILDLEVSRPGRKRCRPHFGAKRIALGRLWGMRAHGAHQPIAHGSYW